MRIVRMLLAVVALLALTASPAFADTDRPAMADYPAAQRSALQDQADANHLSPEQARSLQARVDQVIARFGGAQVAINQVAWNGRDTLIPLPGEKRARELGAAANAHAVNGCHYFQLCTYGHSDFTGMVDRMSSCTWHVSHGYFVAYVNNQTPGIVADFYDYYGRHLWYGGAAFYKGSALYRHATHYIRPC